MNARHDGKYETNATNLFGGVRVRVFSFPPVFLRCNTMLLPSSVPFQSSSQPFVQPMCSQLPRASPLPNPTPPVTSHLAPSRDEKYSPPHAHLPHLDLAASAVNNGCRSMPYFLTMRSRWTSITWTLRLRRLHSAAPVSTKHHLNNVKLIRKPSGWLSGSSCLCRRPLTRK